MTTADAALRSILPIAGWSHDRAADASFSGGTDPVLPTPFRIGVAGASTVAAAALAAAALWEARMGRRQQVSVDLRQATAIASLPLLEIVRIGDSAPQPLPRGDRPLSGIRVPDEFDAEELARWSMTSETPGGPLRHLRPVAGMSETPPHWARPSVPPGHHKPVWPAQGAA